MQKPEWTSSRALPAIAIEQRGSAANPRSTIATTTEIYDYLRLLFSSAGQPHDPRRVRPFSSSPPSRSPTRSRPIPGLEDHHPRAVHPLPDGEFGTYSSDQAEGSSADHGQIVGWRGPIKLYKARPIPSRSSWNRLVIREGSARGGGRLIRRSSGRLPPALLRQPRDQPESWQELKYSTESAILNRFHDPQLTPKHFSFNSHLGPAPPATGSHGVIFDCDLMIQDPQKSLKQGGSPVHRTGKRCSTSMPASCGRWRCAIRPRRIPRMPNLPSPSNTPSVTAPARNAGDHLGRGGSHALRAPFEAHRPDAAPLRDTESELTRNRLRQYMSRRSVPSATARGSGRRSWPLPYADSSLRGVPALP